MPVGIISHLISRGMLDAHLSIVVTDLDMHAMWLSRVFHRYFVAIEETKIHRDVLGLPPERVTVSGIPVDPSFADPVNRAEIRYQNHLDPEKTTLLVSAGALGVTPAEFVVARLLQMRHDVQGIVICGRNDELRHRLKEMLGPQSSRFKVIGYTDKMQEYMKISDLFIGKPGGLTTAETLASSLPMIIVDPIPGQEERNSDHLLEKGCALKSNELTTLAWKIDELLDEPDRLALMKRNCTELGRPNAAQTIVETLITDNLPPLELDADQRDAIAQAATGEVPLSP
jgi:processive 1,2-diacylglycerol beta-glucosyltransferase